MNRKLMLGVATFLAIVGMALVGAENEVEAGRGCGGGLLSRLHARKADCGCPAPEPVCPAPAPVCAPACEPACPPTCGGGLMSRLKAKHAARKAARQAKKCCPAPEPCCAPAPEPCCAPAPAPEPCCAPAPAPAPEPCCGAAPVAVAAPVAAAPCCGGGGEVMMSEAPMVDGNVVYGVPTEASPSDMGGAIMVNDRGEQIVPGSVQVINDGSGDAVEAAAEAATTDGI